MKLWPVAPFFHSLLEWGNIQKIAACHFFTAVQEMTCCNVLYVPRFQKWVKKGATGQSFIRKEITSYRIGTLIPHLCVSDWHNLVSLLVYIEAGRSTTSTTLTFTTASTSGITWKAKVTQIECYRWVLSIPFLKSNYFKEQHSTFSYLR